MSKENDMKRVSRLKVYIERLKQQSATVPKRHEHRPEVYKAWVALEIRKAEATITRLSL